MLHRKLGVRGLEVSIEGRIAAYVELSEQDDEELDRILSQTEIQGGRYPEAMERMTGL